MASSTWKLVGELAFCGFLGGIGWLALSGLEGLTKSPFDYLGSAEVPRVLAWLLILLAALVASNIVRVAIMQAKAKPLSDKLGAEMLDDVSANGPSAGRQAGQTALMIVATLLYIIAILWSAIPYSMSTTVFLIVGMGALAPNHQRRWRIIVPLSLFIGALGEYIFVTVLLLPFPGW